MRIDYKKPTTEDKRRIANFWLALGSFTSSVVFTQVLLLGIAGIIVLVLFIKFIAAIIGGLYGQ